MFFEEKWIYFPTKYPNGDWQPAGIDFEEAWIHAQDGTKIHGWFFSHRRPERYVLYLHGNADYVANLAGLAQLYRDELRADILVFDYRGYGRSEGSPTESGLTLDGMAARKWLAHRSKVAESEIILVGRSLGGGVATTMAVETTPKALILQNTFSSLPDVAAYLYPWLPVRFMRNRFDSASKIGHCESPVFQSHGTDDEIVPFELATRLYEKIAAPKEFFPMQGGTHNDPDPPQYFIRLRNFLQRQLH